MGKRIGIGLFAAIAAAAGCSSGTAAAQGKAELSGAEAAAAAPAEAAAEPKGKAVGADEVLRVPVAEARRKVQEGAALLVCAYDSDEQFAAMRLAGAISWKELQARLPALDKAAEIILYCG